MLYYVLTILPCRIRSMSASASQTPQDQVIVQGKGPAHPLPHLSLPPESPAAGPSVPFEDDGLRFENDHDVCVYYLRDSLSFILECLASTICTYGASHRV